MYLSSNMSMSCETCIKNDVCKYKKEKEQFIVPTVPNFLDISIKCKYYSCSTSAITFRNCDSITTAANTVKTEALSSVNNFI